MMIKNEVVMRIGKNPKPRKQAETITGTRTAIHGNGFLKKHVEQAI